MPADDREPRPRRHDRDGVRRRRHGSAPTAEPRTRAARVDARRRAEVLPEVQQDVDEPAACLGGRAERVGMKTAAPGATSPRDGPVDGLGAASGEPLYPSNEREGRVSLDDEVDVIALDREVDDTEGGLVGRRERRAEA